MKTAIATFVNAYAPTVDHSEMSIFENFQTFRHANSRFVAMKSKLFALRQERTDVEQQREKAETVVMECQQRLRVLYEAKFILDEKISQLSREIEGAERDLDIMKLATVARAKGNNQCFRN